MASVEDELQVVHVDHIDPKLYCIIVKLSSKHSPTGILMQSEDIVIEWTFLPHKLSKKFKKIMWKRSMS